MKYTGLNDENWFGMAARGRPRHPDILTPREWVVLELLRKHRTNEEIAEELGITLDGAKYHVSSILSKLGVTSREEAAAWRPEQRRAWWVRWPLWAKIASAATVGGALAAMVVLIWVALTADNSLEAPPQDELIPALETVLRNGTRVSFEECGSNRDWVQPPLEDVASHPYLTGVAPQQVRETYDRRFFTVLGDGALSANRSWVVSTGLEGDRASPPWPPDCPARDVFRIYLLHHEAMEVRRLDDVFVVLASRLQRGYSAINLSSLAHDSATVYFIDGASGLVLDCRGTSCGDIVGDAVALPTSPASLRTEGLLLTRNRGSLAICVQGVGVDEAVEEQAAIRAEELLPELEAHANWGPAGLGIGAPIVRTDCASEPTLLEPNVDLKSGNPLRVEFPSMYRLFVFVLPQAEIDRIFQWQFGTWPTRSVTQELMFEADGGTVGTGAIYLSLEEVADRAFLREWLVKGVGLEPVVPIDQ